MSNLEAYVLPVFKTSISIRPIYIKISKPVIGSIAARLVATYINLTASFTCSSVTTSLSSIFAKASDNLMSDSNYLGVAVMVFLDIPYFLIST